VKYIANSAAKNISSLESQTIVPTATRFGRVILCGLAIPVLDMRASIPENAPKGLFVTYKDQNICQLSGVKQVTCRKALKEQICV
jgi:hypothetical protein